MSKKAKKEKVKKPKEQIIERSGEEPIIDPPDPNKEEK